MTCRTIVLYQHGFEPGASGIEPTLFVARELSRLSLNSQSLESNRLRFAVRELPNNCRTRLGLNPPPLESNPGLSLLVTYRTIVLYQPGFEPAASGIEPTAFR